MEIESLKVSVKGHEIVKGVSLHLEAGKTLCLVGESGSGKTTTASAIMGLLPKKMGFKVSGSVLFDDLNLLDLTDHSLRKIRGSRISMIFQDPASSLNPVFSIGEQIMENYLIHTQMSPEEAEVKAIEMLGRVGLQDLPDPFETYPHELSGGMKQRAMIAMALCLNPEVLIADEPTSALDLTVQKDILLLLKQFQKATNMATLLITHDFGVVAEMADVVAVMYGGKLVEMGPVYEVLHHPSHPYTKALLSAIPTRENRRKMLPTLAGVQFL